MVASVVIVVVVMFQLQPITDVADGMALNALLTNAAMQIHSMIARDVRVPAMAPCNSKVSNSVQ